MRLIDVSSTLKTCKTKRMKMKTSNNNLLIIAFVLTALVVSILFYKGQCEKVIKTTDTLIVSDTILKVDTFTIDNYVPKEVLKIKRDTLYTKDDKEVVLTTEKKTYKDTISTKDGDSILISNFISGINANLDSSNVILKKREIVNTVEVTNTIVKRENKRFGIGVQVGYGIGINSRQFGPYVGVGLTVNL